MSASDERAKTPADRVKTPVEGGTAQRGSLKMYQERFEHGVGDQLPHLDRVLTATKVEILDFWIRGQPPRIDEFTGVARVPRQGLGTLVDQLLELDRLHLDVWIKGQPPRLDMVNVQFKTPGWH